MNDLGHTPVLQNELLAALHMHTNGTYLDATAGYGGHTAALLAAVGVHGRVIAVDRDAEAVAAVRHRHPDARLQVVQANFAELMACVRPLLGDAHADGIVFDLGLSSPQLDNAARGFSFMRDGPLDMRMDASSGESAMTYLARVTEAELSQVLNRLGEERYARRIARAITRRRQRQPLRTTGELASLVSEAVPAKARHTRTKHAATRTFQALRMRINGELEALQAALPQAARLLKEGGRLAVISFHSLEDREVKYFMRDAVRDSTLRLVGKARRASVAEVAVNPRARSAILRVAERIGSDT